MTDQEKKTIISQIQSVWDKNISTSVYPTVAMNSNAYNNIFKVNNTKNFSSDYSVPVDSIEAAVDIVFGVVNDTKENILEKIITKDLKFTTSLYLHYIKVVK